MDVTWGGVMRFEHELSLMLGLLLAGLSGGGVGLLGFGV